MSPSSCPDTARTRPAPRVTPRARDDPDIRTRHRRAGRPPTQAWVDPDNHREDGPMTTTATPTVTGTSPRSSLRLPVGDIALGVLGILTVVAVLEILPRTGLVNPAYLPPASTIFRTFVELLGDPAFWTNLGLTLRGWAIGLSLAMVLGIAAGLVIGSFRFCRLPPPRRSSSCARSPPWRSSRSSSSSSAASPSQRSSSSCTPPSGRCSSRSSTASPTSTRSPGTRPGRTASRSSPQDGTWSGPPRCPTSSPAFASPRPSP